VIKTWLVAQHTFGAHGRGFREGGLTRDSSFDPTSPRTINYLFTCIKRISTSKNHNRGVHAVLLLQRGAMVAGDGDTDRNGSEPSSWKNRIQLSAPPQMVGALNITAANRCDGGRGFALRAIGPCLQAIGIANPCRSVGWRWPMQMAKSSSTSDIDTWQSIKPIKTSGGDAPAYGLVFHTIHWRGPAMRSGSLPVVDIPVEHRRWSP